MSAAAGRVVVCAALLVSVWACSPVDRREQMIVELDVFSGRPNPQWVLTKEEAARVEDLLQNLPSPAETGEPGLGYRGFVLTSGSKRITVGSGVVRTEEEKHTRTYQDAKGLEAYLRGLARGRGYSKFIEGQHP